MRAWATAALCAALCAALLSGCGDTLQDQPIGRSPLEAVIVKSRFPVYWAGSMFDRMELSAVTIDPGGAVTLQYGDCLVGGQYTCVAPLSVVTSPDNSFLPLGSAQAQPVRLRGLTAFATRSGRGLSLRTGSVVVSVYARDRRLALAAADTMVPLNKAGLPGQPLPAALADTGFDRLPLPSQLPPGAPAPTTPLGAPKPARPHADAQRHHAMPAR